MIETKIPLKIVPRIYQKGAVKAGLKGLRSAMRRALVVMATGLGKTITSALIAKAFRPRRILFLVHNNFILKHAIDEYRLVFGDSKTMVTYNGLSKKGAGDADIVFATWQTMTKNRRKWKRDHFDLIVVDESHHTAAQTYKPTLDYFKAAKLGITATPDRSDKEDIRDIFGPAVIDISLEEAIARGWLPRIEYHVISDESLDEEMLQKIAAEIESGKRFTMKEVNKRVFIKKRDKEIAKIINSYNEKAIIFCSSIIHAKRTVRALNNAAAFHSKAGKTLRQTWTKNQSILDKLKAGTIQRVCGVNALNEGVDVPSVGLVAFCRVTEFLSIFRQQLGRGLRPGKERLIVLDFVGNLERIQLVLEMMNKISDLHEEYTTVRAKKREGYRRERFEVSGKGFEFTFSDAIVDAIRIMEHCNREFYPTWMEAGAAAQRLGILGQADYNQKYKKDPRLPSSPADQYPDFPRWADFLAKEGRRDVTRIYPTWQEASKAALRLGISTATEYGKRYSADPRLPSAPAIVYPDFPDWYSFFGKAGAKRMKGEIYPTLRKAAAAALKLGIASATEYNVMYKKDGRLPSTPHRTYPDWPGWKEFLKKRRYHISRARRLKRA